MPYFHNLQEIEIQVITDFSRMDFPTLISYTRLFLNQGLHGGIYIFYSDFNRTFYKKPRRPWSEATFCRVWSGSAMFVFFYVPQQEQVMHTIGSFLNRHLKQYFKIFFAFHFRNTNTVSKFLTQTVWIQFSSTLFRAWSGSKLLVPKLSPLASDES